MCGERPDAEPVDLAVADLVLHPGPDHHAVAAVGGDELAEERRAARRSPSSRRVDRPDSSASASISSRAVDRERAQQVFLVGEVEVEGAVRRAGRAHDVVDPALVVARARRTPACPASESRRIVLRPWARAARAGVPGVPAVPGRASVGAELCDPEPMLPQTTREAARRFGDATAYVTEPTAGRSRTPTSTATPTRSRSGSPRGASAPATSSRSSCRPGPSTSSRTSPPRSSARSPPA